MALILTLACTLLLFPALATSREVCLCIPPPKQGAAPPQNQQRTPRRLQLASQKEPSTANNNPIKDLADHFVEIRGGEFTVDCRVWVRGVGS